jgi:hypothetical protein
VENRLLKKTENSKIKTAKRIQNVKDAAKGQNDLKNTLASIASMRLFLLTFLILISNSGVETWHIIHLSNSTSFLLFLGLEGQSLSGLPNCDISRIKNVSYELVL